MAKPPWADIVTEQSGNGYVEEVVSDVGEHLRTRPAPGATPPGGGRPSRDTSDNAPIAYHNEGDREFGLRDNEELYSPPPPERPADGATPQQPQEFEAVWMDRYLKRTQGQKDPETKKLILPASYNSATPDDADIMAMQQQMRVMQASLEAAMARKAEEAEKAKAVAEAPNNERLADGETAIMVRVVVGRGKPYATISTKTVVSSVDAATALTMIKGML